MKSVTARLSIEVFVDCPHCGHFIDLMDADDTNGRDHNEGGHVVSQACPDGSWTEKHKKFKVEDVECSECKKPFSVKELEW